MSVQLIVYPQGHNGVYNAFSNPDTDFIVNGSNFTGLGNAPAISNYSIYNAIFLNPATVPNSWYRYAYPDPVSPPIQYPSESNGHHSFICHLCLLVLYKWFPYRGMVLSNSCDLGDRRYSNDHAWSARGISLADLVAPSSAKIRMCIPTLQSSIPIRLNMVVLFTQEDLPLENQASFSAKMILSL